MKELVIKNEEIQDYKPEYAYRVAVLVRDGQSILIELMYASHMFLFITTPLPDYFKNSDKVYLLNEREMRLYNI